MSPPGDAPGADGSGRTVVLAVTGGIAAYKACEVLRRLGDEGFDVRVAMTRAATEFVGPTTFAALSGSPVISDLFDPPRPEEIPHVRWAEECDLFCVVPATANFLAKMALGIADDFPSTLHLAVTAPVLVAPAMEDDMFAHPAVRANLETLRERGVIVVGPDRGPLASGRWGPGRMAEPGAIIDAAVRAMAGRPAAPLRGVRVLVAAGPTRERLDPVRLFTNPSTGKMGYAMAAAARDRGGAVVLVTGPSQLPPPTGVETVRVESAEEMAAAVLERASDAAVVVMAAAVSDYRPKEASREKLKKGDAEEIVVEMVRTPDILEALGRTAGERTVVGFAAETSELEDRAAEKMSRKGCDLIVGNRVDTDDGGFESDTNRVVVLDRRGGRAELGPASKRQVAEGVWDRIVAYRERGEGEGGP